MQNMSASNAILWDECDLLARNQALLNQNMNQAIAAIRQVAHILSGTEPYLR